MRIKKLIASILAVMMLVGTFPMYAFAEEDGEQPDASTQKVNVIIYHVDEQGDDIGTPEFYEKNQGDEFFAYYKHITGYHAENGSMGETVRVEKAPGETQTVYMYYVKNEYNVSIKYVKVVDGQEIPMDNLAYTATITRGNKLSVASPDIEGFIPDEKTVSVDSVTADINMTVKYYQSREITIKYVDEYGDKLDDDNVVSVADGSPYVYTTPAIEGYAPEEDIYKIDSVEEDQDLVITYLKQNFTVDIHFVKDDKEFSNKSYGVKRGETLTYECPQVEGYDIPFDSYTVTTDPIDMDREITVEYSKKQYLITVHYVDKNGKTVAPDAMEQVEYMDSIEIDNPVIEGYKTDADAISISNVDEDMEVSVVYTKIEKKDDNKKSDSPDTGDEDSLMLMLLMMMGAGAGLVAIRKREE